MQSKSILIVLVLGLAWQAHSRPALGQGYGSDTQNVLTPAAGGMAGVSLASRKTCPRPSSATRPR